MSNYTSFLGQVPQKQSLRPEGMHDLLKEGGNKTEQGKEVSKGVARYPCVSQSTGCPLGGEGAGGMA